MKTTCPGCGERVWEEGTCADCRHAETLFRPGMSQETRDALREACGGFLRRVTLGNRREQRSRHRKTIASRTGREQRYYGTPSPAARFVVKTYVDPGRAEKALEELREFGVEAEVVEACPHDRRTMKPGTIRGSFVEACGCSARVSRTGETWECGHVFRVFPKEVMEKAMKCGACGWGRYPLPTVRDGTPQVEHNPSRCGKDPEPLARPDGLR